MILFDVDGVFLSEERYFDASTLTVWELLISNNYLGLQSDSFTPVPDESVIRRVRRKVFHDDKTLHFVKNRGINSNWDIVYLTFSCQLIHGLHQLSKVNDEAVRTFLHNQIDRKALQDIGYHMRQAGVQLDFSTLVSNFEATTVTKQQMIPYLNTISEEKTGISTTAFSRNSPLWELCQETFQEWYLGEKKHDKPALQKGKKGFLTDEIPIIHSEQLQTMLGSLKERNITLGLGTGRPEVETLEPLHDLDILDYFDKERIVTAQDVLDTERKYPDQAPLSKPQPFTYVYGWLGKHTHAPQAVIDYLLPVDRGEQLLIVGDSPADYYAANSMGATFAAVLTGLSGQNARPQFERLGADYILDDVTEVTDII